MDLKRLSKTIAIALRHKPVKYGLSPDKQGWVAIKDLLMSLRKERIEWKDLAKPDLIRMSESASKKRYEINGERIRALYGHSLPGKLQKKKAKPPEQLFHGTAPSIVCHIMEIGLLPMRRQYVHLSVNAEIAKRVGRRKDKKPVILLIAAHEAHHTMGVSFYIGNAVWLADEVPPEFIKIYF